MGRLGSKVDGGLSRFCAFHKAGLYRPYDKGYTAEGKVEEFDEDVAGTLVNVVIPRPNPNGESSPGVGKVFLEYEDADSAAKARAGLNGRKFGGNVVVGVFYPENKFLQCDYDG